MSLHLNFEYILPQGVKNAQNSPGEKFENIPRETQKIIKKDLVAKRNLEIPCKWFSNILKMLQQFWKCSKILEFSKILEIEFLPAIP